MLVVDISEFMVLYTTLFYFSTLECSDIFRIVLEGAQTSKSTSARLFGEICALISQHSQHHER